MNFLVSIVRGKERSYLKLWFSRESAEGCKLQEDGSGTSCTCCLVLDREGNPMTQVHLGGQQE